MDKIALNTEKMFEVPTFGRGESSLLKFLENYRGRKPVWIATVNPEFVMNAVKDQSFLNILQKRTSVNVVDGIGLLWAREVLKAPRWRRIFTGLAVGIRVLGGGYREGLVTGVELMDVLCGRAAERGETVYFFGGWGDRAKRTAEYFQRRYPGLKVAGFAAEDFDLNTKTDYLFVARGMKNQELWIDRHLERLKTGVVMGVGRSFDYYSGTLSRAPQWIRSMGLEWLYSLYREPKRWRRQLQLPKFIWKVLTY